jgi:hypothetical protein
MDLRHLLYSGMLKGVKIKLVKKEKAGLTPLSALISFWSSLLQQLFL